MTEVSGDRASAVAGRARSWTARLVAYGFPLLLACVAYADLELWPATSWRLFSGVRKATVPTWIVEVDRADGDRVPYDPAASAEARRSWRHQLDRAIDDPDRRDELCQQWLGDARSADPQVRSLHIDRARLDIPRDDAPARVVSRTEVARC